MWFPIIPKKTGNTSDSQFQCFRTKWIVCSSFAAHKAMSCNPRNSLRCPKMNPLTRRIILTGSCYSKSDESLPTSLCHAIHIKLMHEYQSPVFCPLVLLLQCDPLCFGQFSNLGLKLDPSQPNRQLSHSPPACSIMVRVNGGTASLQC